MSNGILINLMMMRQSARRIMTLDAFRCQRGQLAHPRFLRSGISFDLLIAVRWPT
uniref:MIP20239p n=1 Tax=Drosophila melanogaster TaxID=7227 RepID=D5A7M9_DROME|nr:MIP20239p [Drosophila melanogaster]